MMRGCCSDILSWVIRRTGNEQSVEMLMETEGYDEDKAKIIDKKVNDHILGNAFLLNSDYIQFDENYLKEELEEYLQFVKANIAK